MGHGARGSGLQRGCSVRAACEGFHGGWGNFLGLWALLPRLLLYFIYRFVQCKMQKLPRKQKAMLPPRHPPRKCLQIPSPLSLCVSARSCWHDLFILLHSVTVSTGGGDSPLLIRAGPRLLLVGHFFRGGDGVGLALLKLGAAALGAAAHEASTGKAAGCPACGGRR